MPFPVRVGPTIKLSGVGLTSAIKTISSQSTSPNSVKVESATDGSCGVLGSGTIIGWSAFGMRTLWWRDMVRARRRGYRLATGERALLLGLAATALSSCGNDGIEPIDQADPGPSQYAQCDLDLEYLWASVIQDAIPTLDDPVWDQVELGQVPEYLEPDSRVIGIEVAGRAFAVPHNVLWHHEVVNLLWGDDRLAMTYCPITGSSLVFDRSSIGGAELGVSGLQFMGNLVLYDRQASESLWPQLMREARCGESSGRMLTEYPFVEIEWSSWLELHPDTWVISGAEQQGFDPAIFNYTSFGYPYGNYEEIDVWFNGLISELDHRLHLKERVIGLPSGTGDPGIAFPFGTMEGMDGNFQVVPFMFEGQSYVLAWSDEARGGTAFHPLTEGGLPVSLSATSSGFEDDATGSTWTLDGRAVAGPMEGKRLRQVDRTHTAFWGAWAAFHPETRLWQG